MTKEELERKYEEDIEKAVKEFRKAVKFSEDEILTEEKIRTKEYKIKEYKIKDIAVRKSIPSKVLREAILKN